MTTFSRLILLLSHGAQLVLCVKEAPLIDLGESPSTSHRDLHDDAGVWPGLHPASNGRISGQKKSLQLDVYQGVSSSAALEQLSDPSHPSSFDVLPLNAATHVNHPLLFHQGQYHPEVYQRRIQEWQKDRESGMHDWNTDSYSLIEDNDEELKKASELVSQLGPNSGALLIPHHRVIYKHPMMDTKEAFRRFAELELKALTYDEKTGRYKLQSPIAIPLHSNAE